VRLAAGLLHDLRELLLDVIGALDINDIKVLQRRIGRVDMDRSGPDNLLPQIPREREICDPVQPDLILPGIKKNLCRSEVCQAPAYIV
jgi:hypothetical protein